MSATDKDIHQKRTAIQFCAALGIVPFYEVNVRNIKDFTEKPELLTDIDVMGIAQNNYRTTRIIFDCKTTKTSPINRAFWAAGLARYIDADECYVILKRAAPEGHRISAKSMKVHLFDETQFEQHAQALSFHPLKLNDYVVDMPRWHALHDAFRANGFFEKLGEYVREDVPLEADAPKVVRGILAKLRHARGEFDPAKVLHLAIYCYCVMGFSLVMSKVTRDIFDMFDPKQKKEDFERFLRDYIWGGREAYQLRRKLNEVMAAKTDQPFLEFKLHAWDEYVDLVRTLVDSPESVFLSCLPLTGCALRLVNGRNEECDATLKNQLTKNNRQRQFVFRISSYLVAACGLPKEFDDQFKAAINEVMA